MMYSYPFFSFPNFRRYSSNYEGYYINKMQNRPNSNHMPTNSDVINHKNNIYTSPNMQYKREKQNIKNQKNETYSGFNFLNNFFSQDDRNDDEKYLEIFGLKLYNDDLLLLGLIFFLYKEEVKDQYLFFALILLLLS